MDVALVYISWKSNWIESRMVVVAWKEGNAVWILCHQQSRTRRALDMRSRRVPPSQSTTIMSTLTKNLPSFIRDPAVSIIGEVSNALYLPGIEEKAEWPLEEMLRLVGGRP